MKGKLSLKSLGGLVSGLVMLLVIFVLVLFIRWTDANLDYLVQWIKGDNLANVPMWLSSIVAILCNGIALVFNIVMEIIKIVR